MLLSEINKRDRKCGQRFDTWECSEYSPLVSKAFHFEITSYECGLLRRFMSRDLFESICLIYTPLWLDMILKVNVTSFDRFFNDE